MLGTLRLTPHIYIFAAGLSICFIVSQLFRVIFRVWENYAPQKSYSLINSSQYGKVLFEDRIRIKMIAGIILFIIWMILNYALLDKFNQFPIVYISLAVISFMIIAFISLIVPDKIFQLLDNMRLEKMNKQLIEAMNIFSLSLRSARNFEQSLPLVISQTPQPLSREFEQVYQEVNVGGSSLAEALQRMAIRVPTKDMKIFVSTMKMLLDIGGPQADLLDKNAHLMRERQRIKQKIHSLTAEGRFSAISIAAAPFVVLILNYMIDPVTIQEFITHPVGMLILAVICVSDYLGYRIIKKMSTITF